MNQNVKKLMILQVILITLTVLSSACDHSTNKSSLSDSERNTLTEPDHSSKVTLQMYLIGEAPQGMPEVLRELNKKLLNDINATIDLHYIGWGDLRSKYSLILAAGQDVDIIYASNWNYYVQEASKNAFLPLSEELIKRYLPRHNAKMDPAGWKEAEINGEIYMIPTSTPEKMASVFVIRKDLREKYGIPPITRLSELGPYLKAIKQNEPGMVPMNIDAEYDLAFPYIYIMNDKIAFPGGTIESGNPSDQGITFNYNDPSGKLYSMIEEPFLSVQKYAAGIMKDWYDKGYINKNPYANNVPSQNNFCAGKTGVAFGNSNNIEPMIEECESKGIDVDIISVTDENGKIPMSSWLINGLAIAAGSRNAERALQAIDLIMEDPSYVYLTYYGIEGKHYVLTSDDKIALPEGVTPETNAYPLDRSGFWFVNKEYLKPMASWPEAYVKHLDNIKDNFITTPYTSFSFNPEHVKSEISSLSKVSAQYARPIYIGAVDNIDQAFEHLKLKLQAAGIEKVKKEVQKQAAVFLDKKNK
ncbi:hypothetical protein PAECIP111892_03100 [Paenibacillus auburnensis]|uniref:DUF3502 domain-containing protein n=1 Tax=Paenibacillus auburnensis TaxID=2905649 RepID=A0ABM9CBX4_9BACL|nr:extracellular solute-binding protein [Paenibacillus auburnensis]CAH1208388.1 hypothetical protein PAECIP111892_03100 [Paenibacillus auburnensis]